jgi:hypothetical protein
MDSDVGGLGCRSCGATLTGRILDLGWQPLADVLVGPGDPGPDPAYPLGLAFCDRCFLVQLADSPPDVEAPHGHGEAFSPTTREAIAGYVRELLSSQSSHSRRMVAVGAAPDGLVDTFRTAGWSVAGIEPGRAPAADFVRGHEPADLVLAHHALAHVDDLDDAVAGLGDLVAPHGTIAIEAHHVLGIVANSQFDVVGHAHRSYLSLASLEQVLERHGLRIVTARRVDAYGGSIQVTARPAASQADDAGAAEIRALRAIERSAGLDRAEGYAGLDGGASRTVRALQAFLEDCRARQLTVAGYGAPARGTTLLNAARITPALLPFTVDRSPAKQGRVLPGCRIPIRAPDAIDAARPNRILILPWPLRSEIERQLSAARTWGGRFVVALPELAVS